jgi:hypothetical protein
MQDALELANTITSCNGDINVAIKTYEQGIIIKIILYFKLVLIVLLAMFPRVAEKAEESATNLGLFFTDDAPKSFIDKMAELMAGGPPQ